MPIADATDGLRAAPTMRILFLCGCLEPAKDGVGDYTRNLAAECERLGHEVALVSLNDFFASPRPCDSKDPTEDEFSSIQNSNLQRFGGNLSWGDRAEAVRKLQEELQPDLVSLQFVPYSFHPSGLNFALPKILSDIQGNRPVQIMFHEIWIGEQIGAGAKARIIGFGQRKIAQSMLKRLDCKMVHTSNRAYLEILRRNGIVAKLLPLFGSIPVRLDPRYCSRTGPTDAIRLGMFGTVHPEWSADDLLKRLFELGRPIELSHIGSTGPGEIVWNNLVSRYGGMVKFDRLGEQAVAEIARFFAGLDFGVATTPLALIGKSATVAAMLEFGLPVIVTRNDVRFHGINIEDNDDQLITLDNRFLERIKTAKRRNPESRLPRIAAQFLEDVGGKESGARSQESEYV